jgi:hypothetical protein
MVFQVNMKEKVSRWLPFWATSLTAFWVYKALWAIDSYWELLSILGILSCILAIRVIWYTGLNFRPLALVIGGLVLGQWWFIEIIIVKVLWGLGGFAP